MPPRYCKNRWCVIIFIFIYLCDYYMHVIKGYTTETYNESRESCNVHEVPRTATLFSGSDHDNLDI